MTLKEFAQGNQLRAPRKDECGDYHVIGKRGDIYEYGRGLFAATIITKLKSAFHWIHSRQAALEAGCKVTQNGDTEGTFLFDPQNPIQVAVALQSIRISKKRQISVEHLRRLHEGLNKSHRLSPRNDDRPKTDP